MEVLLTTLGNHGYIFAMMLLFPLVVAAKIYNFLPLRPKRPENKDQS